MLVRFEDLIGEQGGGSRDRQVRTVRKIAHHLGTPLDFRETKRVADRAFSSDSKTFRKRKVGDWRNHFTKRHVDAAKRTLGDVLIQLGYEDRKNWTIR